MKKPVIIDTADGSKTLYLEDIDEQYHSVNGAKTESEHVFVKNGYSFHGSSSPKILEIGFGTGLNCLLTAIQGEREKRKTYYYAIEKYPLKTEILEKLNYGDLISPESEKLFQKIHNCEWEKTEQISPYFQLQKLKIDLVKDELSIAEACDVIYFDAFGPDKQSEMWTPAIFKKIVDKTLPCGVFVTYSAKGQVRRQLTALGFKVERLPGPPGKKEMLRGIKV